MGKERSLLFWSPCEAPRGSVTFLGFRQRRHRTVQLALPLNA